MENTVNTKPKAAKYRYKWQKEKQFEEKESDSETTKQKRRKRKEEEEKETNCNDNEKNFCLQEEKYLIGIAVKQVILGSSKKREIPSTRARGARKAEEKSQMLKRGTKEIIENTP